MNPSDILLHRRWSFYQEQAPTISKEIYNLLQCYDEPMPYLEIFYPDNYMLPGGENGTVFLRLKAENSLHGYKVSLYYDRSWQEVQDLGLLCEIYTRLTFQSVWKAPKAMLENQCIPNLSKLPE